MRKQNCIICTFFLLAISITGCNDNNEMKDDGEAEIFYAKVEDASLHSNIDKVKVQLIGNFGDVKIVDIYCSDWKDGCFTFSLPKTVNPNYLGTYHYVNQSIPVGNENVKVGEVYFLGFNKDGYRVTGLTHAGKTEDGYVEAFYTYVDSDATIFGDYAKLRNVLEKDDNGDCIPCLWEINTTFSVELKKGWNIWYLSSSVSRTERTIKERWSTIPVRGLKWYFVGDFAAIKNFSIGDCVNYTY